jgi:hypothetical protein
MIGRNSPSCDFFLSSNSGPHVSPRSVRFLLRVIRDPCCQFPSGGNMKRSLTITSLSLVFIVVLGGHSLLGQQNRSTSQSEAWEYLQEKYDANGDDQLTEAEYPRGAEKFQRLDANSDGVISANDWGGAIARKSLAGRQKRSRSSTDVAAPAQGDRAPSFSLSYVNDPSKSVELASFKGSKPVALIFGSCS